MRPLLLAALAGATVAGCALGPPPPPPVRLVDSPADVSTCRRLGSVGQPVRTDGTGPDWFDNLVLPEPLATPPRGPVTASTPVPGENLAERLRVMRGNAVALGATDLLLTRRFYRDWSFVEGTAYRCRT